MTPPVKRPSSAAFTLLELLAAVTVLTLILLLIASVTNSVTTTVRRAEGRLGSFTAARSAFDIMNRKISQATLNTYWDYYRGGARWNSAAGGTPDAYGRYSDLHFLIRRNLRAGGHGQEIWFQAPLARADNSNYQSAPGLLNACGFFIAYNSDENYRPVTVSGRPSYRYRLMQCLQPTENLQVFANVQPAGGWTDAVAGAATPIGDNIVALVIWPRLAEHDADSAATGGGRVELTSDYTYNSRDNTNRLTLHQQPPELQLTVIVIDETAWRRIDPGADTPPAVIENALQGKFQNVARYLEDLEQVAQALDDARIEHKILTTTVSLRESKWSSQ